MMTNPYNSWQSKFNQIRKQSNISFNINIIEMHHFLGEKIKSQEVSLMYWNTSVRITNVFTNHFKGKINFVQCSDM